MHKIIMVVDTNILRLRLKNVLIRFGLKDLEFLKTNLVGAKQALSQLKEAALVILDLDNTAVDAIEVIRAVRSNECIKGVPILAFGNSAGVAFLSKAVAAGCSDFILKPFEDEFFLAKVLKNLPNQKAAPITYKQFQGATQSEGEGDNGLSWETDFEIGVEDIDADHREIVNQFKQLYLLMRNGKGHTYTDELLAFLQGYVQNHFEREEAYQSRIAYPLYQEHKVLHEDFKRSVNTIIEQHKDKPISNSDLIRISLFIKDWLIHHILIEDRKMLK